MQWNENTWAAKTAEISKIAYQSIKYDEMQDSKSSLNVWEAAHKLWIQFALQIWNSAKIRQDSDMNKNKNKRFQHFFAIFRTNALAKLNSQLFL